MLVSTEVFCARILAGVVGCGVLCCGACSFDSAGQGGSGTPQGTSSEGGDAPTTTAPSGAESGTDPPSTSIDPSGSVDTTSAATTSTGDTTASTRTDDDTSTGDVGPPEFGPFGEPELVDELNTLDSDDDPTLRYDLREIYFASLRSGGAGSEDIWRAVRDEPGGEFVEIAPVVALNSTAQDGWPDLSHDGLVLTFASSRAGGEGGIDVYVATRRDIDDEFGSPVLAGDLSTSDDEAGVTFTSSMLEAFLCSPLLVGSDLRLATRTDAGMPFAEPTLLLTTLASAGRDCAPFVDPDGTRVVFASDRIGTAGAMDLYTAQREGEGDAFGANENLSDLNSIFDDDDPWWAPDGSALYFSSARDGGDLDIWVAYRE